MKKSIIFTVAGSLVFSSINTRYIITFLLAVILPFAVSSCTTNDSKEDSILGYWIHTSNPYFGFHFEDGAFTFRRVSVGGSGELGVIKAGKYYIASSGEYVLSVQSFLGMTENLSAVFKEDGFWIDGSKYEKIESFEEQLERIKAHESKKRKE